MALTATFAADLQAFTKSISDAQVNLQVFDRATKTASRSVTRELESISGQRVAVEAAKMAEAVKRLGGEGGVAAGLLKLTDTELKRFASTMDAAADKAGKLGEQLPASLKHARAELAKIPQSTDRASKGLGFLSSSFASLTASFTAASLIDRGVSALFQFGAEAIESAGQIVDLANKTGLSTDAIQEMQFVAGQTGASLEDFTGAVFKLGVNVSKGSLEARDAVRELGLSLNDLRDQIPEEQFRQAVAALEQVESQTERNRLGQALFGKQWSTIAASVEEGYSDIASAATKSTQEQLDALDRAGDAIAQFKSEIGKGLQQSLGNVASALLDIERGADSLSSGDKAKMFAKSLLGGEVYLKQLQDIGKAIRETEQAEREREGQKPDSAPVVPPDYVASLASLQTELADLTVAERAQIDAALQMGTAQEEISRTLGISSEQLKLYQAQIRESAQAVKSATTEEAKHQKAIDETDKKRREAANWMHERYFKALEEEGDLIKKSSVEGMKASLQGFSQRQDALEQITQAHEKYRQELERLDQGTGTALNAQIAEINRWADNEVHALDKTAEAWKENERLIRAIAGKRIEKLIEDDVIAQMVLFANLATEAEARVEALNKAARDAVASSLRELSSAFADLAQATGKTDGPIGAIAELIGLMGIAATAGNQFNAGLETLKKGGIDNVTAGLIQMSAAAVAAAASLAQATDKAGKANRALSGAAAGAAAGSAFGPWGTIIGAAAGAIVGLARKPAFEDVMKRVGHEWGVDISEGLARSIADESKKLFGGNRAAAEIFNIDKIIGEAGGLSSDNLSAMTEKLRDVFVMVETGAFTSAQAVEVLDENWDEFVEASTDAAGRITPALKEIIALYRRMGLESQAINGFLQQQGSTAITGFNAVVAGAKDATDQWAKYGQAVRDATEKGDQGGLTRALEAQFGAAERARGELEAMGVQALAVFNAATSAGTDYFTALEQIQPGLTTLRKAYADLGLNIDNAALSALAMQSTMLEGNPQLIAGISGLAQSMVALDNMGMLNVETFQAMQRTASEMYTRLQSEAAAAGGSTRDALLPMQGFLQEAAKQAELLGVPLDENTQMLIDQSKELGIWKDKGKTATEQLVDVMTDLRDVLKDFTDNLQGIPRRVETEVRTKYTSEGEPPAGSPARPAPPVSASTLAAAAAGGADRQTIHVPVYVDGREITNVVIDRMGRQLSVRGGR